MKPASAPHVPTAVLAVALVALTSGCFTTLLWEADVVPEEDDGGFPFDEDPEGGFFETLGAKLLLTPFALVLDVLTLPLQEALGVDEPDFDDEGEDGC